MHQSTPRIEQVLPQEYLGLLPGIRFTIPEPETVLRNLISQCYSDKMLLNGSFEILIFDTL